MEFTFNPDPELALKAATVGGGIRTGIHDLTIKGIEVEKDKSGNPRVNIFVINEDGKTAVIYGLMTAPNWTTGSENKDYAKWLELATVIGMQSATVVPHELQVSKTKKETRNVIKESIGTKAKLVFQECYSIIGKGPKKGQERNELKLSRSFYTDGKSLGEKKENKPAKDIEYYKDIKPWYNKEHQLASAEGTIVDPNKTEAKTAEAEAPAQEDTPTEGLI